ncbi:EfeM/EfeO family lipoprotein [Glaesserella parasuis]|nr:EfeM/EfeO family lipoprotein [Glaesserella parasuis]MDP0342038.1 EfeM/EfeO family lipoprotein [Glaesserella parasuis]MDP0357854.1 EfeM/EfeO family lipoprotein [Glaesserella parasuis]
MRLKSLTLAILSLFVASSVFATDLSKETQTYKEFVVGQIDQLVTDTEKFVGYLKAGDVEKAKQIYPLARMYFERSEPIAESFGDLDPRIDTRLADLSEEEIFSKTDLYDFKANIEGAEKIYEIFKAKLEKKDAKLAKEIADRFQDVNVLLEKHNKSKDGYDYVPYNTLTDKEIKALAEAVNKLGEPLAQMGILLGK